MKAKRVPRGLFAKQGGKRAIGYRPRLELLEDRVTPTTLEVPLHPALDLFGDQFEVVQVYGDNDGLGDRVTFAIFDTGASPVTFGWVDQLFFELLGQPIPTIPGATVTAEGVGGSLTGLVSEPGTILADGMHAVDLAALLDGQDSLDMSAAAGVANVQAMIGTETGSPVLPAIVGTPILNGGLGGALSGGVAARIDMRGYLIDFGALFPEVPEYQGLILPMPDVSFVAPGTALTQSIETDPSTGEGVLTTVPVRVPVDFIGIDNSADPGNTITESYNPTVKNVQATHTVNGFTLGVQNQTFLFDTGAQLSIVSTAVALSLGLDLDNPETSIDIQGAGGAATVPGYTIDTLTLPLDDDNNGVIDGELIFTNVPIFVLDVHPSLDGILGMNLMNPAYQMLYDPNDPDGSGPAGPSLQFTFSNVDRDLNGDGIDDSVDGGVIGLLDSLFPMFAGTVGGQNFPGFDLSEPSTNQPPTVAADQASVSVTEGLTAQNTGAFGDPDGDAVQISANVGSVTQSAGVWNWSLATTDGSLGPITVVITADDGQGGVAQATFTFSVANVAPTIAISGASKVNEGAEYTLTLGAVTDPGTDTITSYIVHWGDGTSNTYASAGAKTHTYADGPASRAITVDLQDEDGTFLDQANALSVAVDNVAPTIAISGASNVNEGVDYILSLGTVTDPGMDTIASYIVHWGDGTSDTYSSPGAVIHTYADGPASCAITVDLQDEDGAYADQANALTVSVADVAPTIAVSGATSVNEGADYILTVGAVTDPGADTITNYIVHWGDGTSETYSSPGAVIHTYADGPSNYTITVDLQDEDGTYLDQADALTVSVGDVAPTIVINGVAGVNEGAGYTITLGEATDPGADTVTSYTVNWGDGTSDTYTSPGAETHTYADGPGSYTVTVDIQDEESTYLDQGNALSVAVDNVAPTIAITGASRVDEGADYTITLGEATDPGADTITSYTVQWGDGTSDTYTSAGAATHTYADGPSSYTITVDLQDEEGTYLDQANALSVAVDDVAPTIAISGAAHVNEGGGYTLTLGAATDPGGDPITSYIVHWGDGTSDTYSTPGVKTHFYADGPVSRAITVDLQGENGTFTDQANALSVAVDDVAPSIALVGNAQVNRLAPYTLQLGAVVDPGNDTVTGYRVNWGDGSSTGFVAGAPTGQTLQHIYVVGGVNRVITVDLYNEDAAPHAAAGTKTVTVSNAAPNLKVKQKGTPAIVARGRIVTLAITLTNLGNSRATGVFTTLQLPAGMTFVVVGSTTGWQNIGVRRFRLDVGALEPGQAIKVFFRARVARSVIPGSSLITTARVGNDGLNGPDAILADNTKRWVTRVS